MMRPVGVSKLSETDSLTASLSELVRANGNPLLKAIEWARAEVCAQMFRDHDDKFTAFRDCYDFMLDFCRPGKNKQMDGGKNEASTGEGYCKAYFPVAQEMENIRKTVSHAEDYARHVGTILGKALPAHPEEVGGPSAAQTLCERLGDECAGFTCDADEKACTVRGPGTLRHSHHGEVSYVKPGADVKEEEEEDEGKEGTDGMDEKQEGAHGRIAYEQHLGEVLTPGPLASEPGEHDAASARERCDVLAADECAGYTCSGASNERCTLRGGPGAALHIGKNGEVSYVREDADVKRSRYELHDGKILENPVSGTTASNDDSASVDVSESEALCDKLGPACAGFTCQKGGKGCVLRGEGELKDSQNGEVSFLKSASSNGMFHMDARTAVPEQGFEGGDVAHSDQQTLTRDWQLEYGPRSANAKYADADKLCGGQGAPSYWCKHRDRLRPAKSSAAAASAALALAYAMLRVVAPALLVVCV